MTTNAKPDAIDFADIKAAASRIAAHAQATPVLTSRSINALVGAELLFKCENLQTRWPCVAWSPTPPEITAPHLRWRQVRVASQPM